MQFTWKRTGPGRVFNGPDKSQGLLACWNIRTLKTFKMALKIPRLDDMEVHEMSLMYYVLSVRAEDHSLLSLQQFEDLQLDEFQIYPHDVTGLDLDGDCSDCNTPIDRPWHTGVDLPPTTPDPGEDPTVGPGGNDPEHTNLTQ